MFVIFATKSLHDGTKGFRFNFLGQKGLVRLRKRKSVPFKLVHDDCMTAVHMRKLSIYFERKQTVRKLAHFAG